MKHHVKHPLLVHEPHSGLCLMELGRIRHCLNNQCKCKSKQKPNSVSAELYAVSELVSNVQKDAICKRAQVGDAQERCPETR